MAMDLSKLASYAMSTSAIPSPATQPNKPKVNPLPPPSIEQQNALNEIIVSQTDNALSTLRNAIHGQLTYGHNYGTSYDAKLNAALFILERRFPKSSKQYATNQLTLLA
ncbi:MAG: hypothetical protein K2X66_08485 [Cyanobacteria bacterium]|nr:hypothetical protein [Cyanobacteriota bacterium]